jgi:hypothetical protein
MRILKRLDRMEAALRPYVVVEEAERIARRSAEESHSEWQMSD